MNLERIKKRCPSDWRTGILKDACELSDHLRLPISAGQRKAMQGIFPYYGPTKILDFINEYRVEGKYVLISEDGDHFLKYAEIPMTLLAEGQFNVNNHAHLLQGGNGCLTEWIFYFYSHASLERYITRQGAGRFKLTKDALLKLPILLPPVAEQERIVTILRCWDSGIEKTKKLIRARNQLKRGFMQQLLTGKKRFQQFTGHEWESVRLSEIFSSRVVLKPKEDGLPLYSLTIVSGLTPKSERYDREALVRDKETKQYKVVEPNDIVFNPSNLRWGAIGISRESRNVLVSPIYETIYVGRPEQYCTAFLFQYLSSPRQIAIFASRTEGTLVERMAVKLGEFLSLKISLPSSVEEQRRIAAVLNACDDEIELLKKQVRALQRQKRGLMQKLLTGQTRVNAGNEIKEELVSA